MKYLAFILLLITFGCNPAKRLLDDHKDFETIGNEWAIMHPCANDTAYTFLAGRIDSIFIAAPVTDTLNFKTLVDSVKREIALKYKASNADCNRQVNEAFTTGYEQAKYVFSKIKIAVKQPDTLKGTVVDNRLLAAARSRENTAVDALAEQVKLGARFKQHRNAAYVIAGLELLFLLLLIIILIKKL